MAYSNDEMMGSPMDPEDHPATNMPQATQHYAGDVISIPTAPSGNAGPTTDATDYAIGRKTAPNVLSIGNNTLTNAVQRYNSRSNSNK